MGLRPIPQFHHENKKILVAKGEKNMTEQFFGQCEYCEGWLHGLRIHDTEQFGELELCKDCRDLADDGELEACDCGALASRDAHTTCRDCE